MGLEEAERGRERAGIVDLEEEGEDEEEEDEMEGSGRNLNESAGMGLLCFHIVGGARTDALRESNPITLSCYFILSCLITYTPVQPNCTTSHTRQKKATINFPSSLSFLVLLFYSLALLFVFTVYFP